MLRALLFFGPLLVAGLALALVAIGERDRDPAFALAQQRLKALDAEIVQDAIASAPEPRADDTGRPARSVACTPGDPATELRNPWQCVARYPSGDVVHYAVEIQPTGDFRAVSRDGVRRVVGRIALGG